jgi:hypothetical protein
MDSWPAWVRWLLVLPVACVAWLFGILAAVCVDHHFLIPAAISILLLSAGFVWGAVATAPRFKLVVAAVLGLGVLGFDCIVYLEGIREANGGGFLSNFLIDIWRGTVVFIVGGVIIAWGFTLWGHLRRRRTASRST